VGVVGNVDEEGDGHGELLSIGGDEVSGEASAGAVEGRRAEVDQGRLRDAWRIVLQRPLVLEAALAKVPIMLVGGGAWILLHGVAGGLGTVALALGALHSARGIGTGIGPLVWARSSRLASARLGLSVGTWLTFAGVALFALASAPTWVFVAVGLWGFGTGAGWETSATRVQILTPRPILGRVASIDQLGLLLSQGLAGLLGALIADASGSAQDAAWFGLAAGIVAWAGLAVVVRRGLAKPPGSEPEGGELTPSGGRSTQRSDPQSS
jgi:MFS family permease